MNRLKQDQRVKTELFELMEFALDYYRTIKDNTGDFSETDVTEILIRLGQEAFNLGQRDAFDKMIAYGYSEQDKIPDVTKTDSDE